MHVIKLETVIGYELDRPKSRIRSAKTRPNTAASGVQTRPGTSFSHRSNSTRQRPNTSRLRPATVCGTRPYSRALEDWVRTGIPILMLLFFSYKTRCKYETILYLCVFNIINNRVV